MAWDDPLVMAAVIASGEALAGRVVAVYPQRRTRNANGTTVRRPMITIEPAIEFARPVGTSLFLSTSPGIKLEVLPAEGSGLIAEVLGGANPNTTIGLLPNLGDDIVLSPYGRPEFYQRSTVDDIPWTHQQRLDDDARGVPVNPAEAAATTREEIWTIIAAGARSTLIDSPPGAGSRHLSERSGVGHAGARKCRLSSRPTTRRTT